jgi:transposase
MNSKLHAVCDGQGRPLVMLLSEGQMSDYQGAALMINALPSAKAMFGKLKDWRRINTRYDRCAHTFMSAICIAATVIF